jgi:hypothetical protein
LALTDYSSTLAVELAFMGAHFANNGGADVEQLETYQRTLNSFRRTIETLGTHRGGIPHDITKELDQKLSEYRDEASS